MVDICSEEKIGTIKKHNLFGVDCEYKKIKKFCELIISGVWQSTAELYSLNSTIMLYGPPGTGKTTLLKNVAKDLNNDGLRYMSYSLELLLDKDLGKSSDNLKAVFDRANDFASMEQKVIFQFDDADSVLCSRYIAGESSGVKRFVNTFIKQLDLLQNKNYKYPPIIAISTNMYPLIDSAVKRRFSVQLLIDNNISKSELNEWLRPIFEDLHVDFNDSNFEKLHELMNSKLLTPGDINLVMQRLLLEKLTNNNIDVATVFDFMTDAESSKITFEKQLSRLSKFGE